MGWLLRTHSHTHEIEQLLFARLVHGRLVHEADHPARPGEPVETLLEQTVADGRLPQQHLADQRRVLGDF